MGNGQGEGGKGERTMADVSGGSRSISPKR